jgi:alpha-beta hydrolase superfamily lysophospholipase
MLVGSVKQEGHQLEVHRQEVVLPAGPAQLSAELALPEPRRGLVLVFRVSGELSDRKDHYLAQRLQQAGCGTLLFDLITPEEAGRDQKTRDFQFDVALLTERLVEASRWALKEPVTKDLLLAFAATGTAAAAAISGGGHLDGKVQAMVCRSGRPDLAGSVLHKAQVPVLLIAGSKDDEVRHLNEMALRDMPCEKHLVVVQGAGPEFDEKGVLEEAALLTKDWLLDHLPEYTHSST